jgi:hypothetical protein
LVVEVLAGLARCNGDAETLGRAHEPLNRRGPDDFSLISGATSEVAHLEMAKAARVLQRSEDAVRQGNG